MRPIGSFLPRRPPQPGRRTRLAAALALLLGLSLLPVPTSAEEPAPAAAPAPAPAPKVSLDQLLKLPDSIEYGSELKGGATPDEWRKRFREAHEDLKQAQAALEQSLAQLHESGESGAWKVAPPGLGNVGKASGEDAAPSNYALSMEIKRNRGEVRRAEQALSDLDVEANLAGVPEEWRR